MTVFYNYHAARNFYRKHALRWFNNKLKELGLDIISISNYTLEGLQNKHQELKALMMDDLFIADNSLSFFKGQDFLLEDESEKDVEVFQYNIIPELYDSNKFILTRIKQLEQNTKVEAIDNLVTSVEDDELRQQLQNEISDLKSKNSQYEELIRESETSKEVVQNEIEIERHKTEMFEKKSNIFLKFIDKESVASVIGALLLLLMGISLIAMMFLEINPIQIVQSSFLLILGYFFGHSKSSK